MASSYAQFHKVSNVQNLTVTVTTSTDGLSEAIDLKGNTLVGLYTPSAWTSADISFMGSHDDTTYYSVYGPSGTETTITGISTSAGYYFPLDPADFAGLNFLKVRSGLSTGETAQGASRSVVLALRSIA